MNKFKKSKYVQSDLKNTFYECLKFLKQCRFVLFSGTGCQISGLLSYLEFKKADTTRLITCDIICHGCPSPDVWSAFVDELEEREKSPLKEIQFRNKKFGWHSHIETFSFENGKNVDSNKWASMFYSNVLFRESCYNCKYTKLNRNSDFTIADCWGIEKSNQLFGIFNRPEGWYTPYGITNPYWIIDNSYICWITTSLKVWWVSFRLSSPAMNHNVSQPKSVRRLLTIVCKRDL